MSEPGAPRNFATEFLPADLPRLLYHGWHNGCFHAGQSDHHLHYREFPTLSVKKKWCAIGVMSLSDRMFCCVFGFWFFCFVSTCNEEVLTGRRRKQEFKSVQNMAAIEGPRQ